MTDKTKNNRPSITLYWLRRSLLWLFVIVLIGACIYAAMYIAEQKSLMAEEKANQTAPPLTPVNVVVLDLKEQYMADRLRLPAVALAWEDVMLMAEISGQVIAVKVKEGDTVQKGDILIEIDKREYQNTLQSIQAKIDLAKKNYSRLQSLESQSAVAINEIDTAKSIIDELSATISTARLNLERCTIRAPFAGIINSLPAKLGMLLSVADPVAQLVDINRVKVEVAVPENDIGGARKLQKAKIVFTALDNYEVWGEKIYLASLPSSQAMVYPLRLAIDNHDHKILPGMFSTIELLRHEKQDAIGIPLYSIITAGDQKVVFSVVDGTARKKPVTTGFLEGWKVQITSGLQAGEKVVIVGHRALEDGQPVKIVKTVSAMEEIGL